MTQQTINRRSFLQRGSTLTVAGAVAGAAGTGMGSPQPTWATESAQQEPHTYHGPDTKPDMVPLEVIVLNRLGFGPRPGDLDAFRALGATDEERLTAYIDQQLNPEGIDDSECDAKLAELGLATMDMSLDQLWAVHVNGDGSVDRKRPVAEIEQATYTRIVYSKRQLMEVLADFWHNHFNVYGWDYWIGPTFTHYDRDVIRGNMLGNFRTMLGDVAKSPAMLFYLDNQKNTTAGANENFSRELFELHTMGADNYLGVMKRADVPLDEEGRPIGYIDKDVYQATESFTGWQVDYDTGLFSFNASDHSKYEKIVLNTPIEDFLGETDGEIVLNLVAYHPGTARHVCQKLCTRLVSDNPPDSLVEQAAAVFIAAQNDHDQLKQVVRMILLSDEFKATWGEKIKRPLEFVGSMFRATNTDFLPENEFYWNYEAAGQGIFQWQPPNGYPDNKFAWGTTMPILQRWRVCQWLLRWDFPKEEDDDPTIMRMRLGEQMPSNLVTPTAIVDYWIDRILGYTMPDSERQPIIEFMAQGRNPDFELPAEDIEDRLPHMASLILMSPSFQWR
ncbi:MAG: DUF1800 domain-containing protein [Chloroflexota bacterium]